MQKAYFPMQVLRVTQGRGTGSHRGTLAMDFGGRDGGCDPVFAPCDMTIVRVRTDAASNGEVYAQSTAPVLLPDGSASVLHFTFIHDDAFNPNVRVGTQLRQGEYFYDEGGRKGGRAGVYGAHLHLEVGRGVSPARQVQNAYGCWGTPKTGNVEDLLWLRADTVVSGDGGYHWKREPQEETNMRFLEVFGDKHCQCFTAPDVARVDTAFHGGVLPTGTAYPLMADVGTGADGYHWVRIYAGGAVRYAVVLADRSRLTELSAGDAVPAVLAQGAADAEKLAALQQSLADAQARAQAAEKTAAQYRQRVEAARAALEG